MNAAIHPAGARRFSLDDIATAVLDERGTVLRWSRAAADLLGWTAQEVRGRPFGALARDGALPGAGESGPALLRHRSGRLVEVVLRAAALEGVPEVLVMAVPAPLVTEWEQDVAFSRGLFEQTRVGAMLQDPELRITRTNVTAGMLDGLHLSRDGRLADVLDPEDAAATESALRAVLETGEPLVRRQQRVRTASGHQVQRSLSLSAFRLQDARGTPLGVASLFVDSTGETRSQRQVAVRHEASTRLGSVLDVVRTAQDLANVLVPALADMATVDLSEAVLAGEDPPNIIGGGEWYLRRVAVACSTGPWPAAMLAPGASIPPAPDLPDVTGMQSGRGLLLATPKDIAPYRELEVARGILPEDAHSAMLAPLFARGLMLGTVGVARTRQSESFDEADLGLLTEIATRAALSVDNARRYAREHHAAVALQQRLLPRAVTRTAAAHTAGTYLPAGGGADISGDWFDVIPLPSLRVAFVVGDVIGHGLHATATMGRLRTAVQTLADLELDPEELLTHLDDLVQRLAAEADPGRQDTVGASCLYALYDPVTRGCVLASAGHPAPIVVGPDGTSHLVQLTPGPLLGVGGMPFETTEMTLEPGSVLALYTDGLIERADHDPGAGIARLLDRLGALCRSGRPLEDIGHALLTDGSAPPRRDDIALLLARTRALPESAVACWEFPADPAAVADARGAVSGQLTAWGLPEMAFTTELIASELLTNAIRYAGGPVRLRLIRDVVLVCEVSDPSNTQPRLRRARITDEGGRGLFLVAQLTARWGSRYGHHSGKTIWTEQPLATEPVIR